jgi:hypothetical protein
VLTAHNVLFGSQDTSLYPVASELLVRDHGNGPVTVVSAQSDGTPFPALSIGGGMMALSDDGEFAAFIANRPNAPVMDEHAYVKNIASGVLTDVGPGFMGNGAGEMGIANGGSVATYENDDRPSADTILYRVHVADLVHATNISPTVCPSDPTTSPRLSADGRFVVFLEEGGGCGGPNDLLTVRFDRTSGTAVVVARCYCGPSNQPTSAVVRPDVSNDGRYVAYWSSGEAGFRPGFFVRDMQTQAVDPISLAFDGSSMSDGGQVWLSADGSRAAFQATHPRGETHGACIADRARRSRSCLENGPTIDDLAADGSTALQAVQISNSGTFGSYALDALHLDTPPQVPPPPTLTLTATPATQTVGDQVTLLAKGAGPKGTLVSFRAKSGPDSGRFAAAVAANSSGVASTIMRGSVAGTDVVEAWLDRNINGLVDAGEASAAATVTWNPAPSTRYVALGDSIAYGHGLADPSLMSLRQSRPIPSLFAGDCQASGP